MAYFDVVKREIDFFKRTPILWAVSFFLPLIISLLICVVFSQGTPTNLPIAVYDEDNSEISRMLIRNINIARSLEMKYSVQNITRGRELLKEGKIYGLMVIPKNFQRDMYRMKQPKLIFYFDNQRILIGGIISKDVATTVQSIMVGVDAKMKSKQEKLPKDVSLKKSHLINIVDHIRSNPFLNYQYFLSLVAFGHVLQIHIIFTGLFALGMEFKHGKTKEWLKTADDSIIIAVLGKMTPYFVILLTLATIIYLFYFIYLNAPCYGNMLSIFLSLVSFIITGLAISIFFISLAGNFRFGLSAASFYSAMGMAFAGVTFPAMAMPLLARIYNAIMPLTYWIKITINQTVREIPWEYDIVSYFCMYGLMSIGLLSIVRLKRIVNNEDYWFRS